MQTVSTDKVWYKNLKKQQKEDKLISSLDPLGIDSAISKLPGLNERADVKCIVRDLYCHLPVPKKLNQFNYHESLACMRDLGFYMGSIKRHNIEPLEAVPELDYILDILSAQTDMPPRDSLLHYTQWNPDGNRARTYTVYKDEHELIRSVKVAMDPLMMAIYQLVDLYQTDLRDETFVWQCAEIGQNFRKVIEGIVIAKRNVSTHVFANELRFYFDPIEVYKEKLIGPGAVEMPLFVYDYILWGSDVQNVSYQEFSRAYLPFNLPSTRDVYYNFSDKPSLVTKVITQLRNSPVDLQVLASGRALLELCKLEKSFRIPHKKLAEESYQKQSSNEQRQVGSGGYSTSMLSDILQENLAQLDRLSVALRQCQY